MLDYNSRPKLHERITEHIDAALHIERAQEARRCYLGASRLGVACERSLQYEYLQIPCDPGRDIDGRVLRIFAVGHALEDLAVHWLRQAGFELYTRRANGEPFGFSVADGRIRGHVDGVVASGPADTGLGWPALWECKTMNDKAWRETCKLGVARAKPVYAAQMAIYQAYLADQIPGIAEHPAIFTAINKNTQELWFEAVPFDAALAQRMSDRGVRVITASEAGEQLPRHTTTPSHIECKFCPWQDRCWQGV